MTSIVTIDTISFTIKRGFITALDSHSRRTYTDYLSKALLLSQPRYGKGK